MAEGQKDMGTERDRFSDIRTVEAQRTYGQASSYQPAIQLDAEIFIGGHHGRNTENSLYIGFRFHASHGNNHRRNTLKKGGSMFSLKSILKKADRRKLTIAKTDLEAKRILALRRKRREQKRPLPAA
jgi:hypothetical protein